MLDALWFGSPNQLASEAGFNFITALELAFSNKSLRQLCQSEAIAKRSLGTIVAEKLKRRLADLRAATCVADLVAGRPREREGSHHHEIVVDLGEGTRLVFCANHNIIPMLESGAVDWSKVSRIKILGIESNHA